MATGLREIEIPVKRITEQMTISVKVRGMPGFRFRMKIAKFLFWLGVRVLGAKPDLDFDS